MKITIRTTITLLLVLAGQAAIAERPQAEDVEAWADALFAKSLAEKRMAGAVLTMVQDGEIVLSKGYGFADLKKGTPVEPDGTQFRIGSNTKTFTATAIAQLMDKGLIDSLDDPANKYLKRLQLPDPGGSPITLRHLLTHSAGFENRVFNIGSEVSFGLPLREDVIAQFEPVVVNPPGKYSSYNNYGTTVPGLIIEDITGQPIAEYFEEHIFKPLDMNNTILNMSPEPSAGLGVSYGFLPNGEPLAIPHRTVHPFFAPVGGINATGNDMGKFMLAHLEQGRNDDAILSEDSFVRLHTQIRSNHALSSGYGMIFFTWNWNGEAIVLHGGDWPGTHSGMILFPDSNTGLFFSLMADYPEVPIVESILGSERLAEVDGAIIDTPISNVGVIVDFLARFFGEYEQPVAESFTRSDLADFEGSYVGQAAPVSTMEKMLNLTSAIGVVKVEIAEAGDALTINGGGPYEEIAPGVFWNGSVKSPIDGFFLDSPLFNFVRDEAGNVDYLVPQIGFDAWIKTGVLGNPQTYGLLWAILFMVFLTAIVTMFYPKIKNRAIAKWLPSIVLVLLIVMPMTILFGYAEGETIVDDLFFGRKIHFTLFALVANIIALYAIYFAWHVYLAWRDGYWSANRAGTVLRVHYSILGFAAVLFIPIFLYLNLLGF